MTTKSAVYRAFSDAGDLLYVGVTDQPQVRLAAHATKERWAEVDDVTLTWYDTRAEAEAAERLAIRTEKPSWNIAVQGEDGRWSGIGQRRYVPTPEVAARVAAVAEEHRRCQQLKAEYQEALTQLAASQGVSRTTMHRRIKQLAS